MSGKNFVDQDICSIFKISNNTYDYVDLLSSTPHYDIRVLSVWNVLQKKRCLLGSKTLYLCSLLSIEIHSFASKLSRRNVCKLVQLGKCYESGDITKRRPVSHIAS